MKDKQHRKEMIADLRTLKPEEIFKRQQDLTEEIFWLEFKNRSGQLTKTADIRKARRMNARLKTIANELKMRGKGVVS